MTDLQTWNLEQRGNELTWEGCCLSELARQYGTPLFVVNSKALERSARSIQEAFQGQGCDAEVFFSYKTNPVPQILQNLARLGIGAEVISEFELELARRLGLSGEKIIVNGSNKSASLLRMAVETGVAMTTVQNVNELCALEKISAEIGVKANVGLRINPGLRKRVFNFTTSTGSSSSPVGFALASQEWKKALQILQSSSAFHFRGLHFHIGSGINKSSPYREALRNIEAFLDDLLEHGLVPEVLDIGGGFSIPTLKEINLWEAVRLFAWNRPQKLPRARSQAELLSEVAAACAETLENDFKRKRGWPNPKVYVEPGRALSASSQLLLLTVTSVVERKPKNVAAVCDGGAMSLSQLLLTEYHSLFVANKAGSSPAKKYNIYGSLPTLLDLVAAKRELPVLSPGDVIAVMDTGAYFTSLGNNFAGPRPAIVMVEDGKAALIRRRETFEDLYSRDKIPGAGEKA
jgi:diaminopimelate decarboxylase